MKQEEEEGGGRCSELAPTLFPPRSGRPRDGNPHPATHPQTAPLPASCYYSRRMEELPQYGSLILPKKRKIHGILGVIKIRNHMVNKSNCVHVCSIFTELHTKLFVDFIS